MKRDWVVVTNINTSLSISIISDKNFPIFVCDSFEDLKII